MAFHDMWDEEPKERPAIGKWVALLLGGTILGVSSYLALLVGASLQPRPAELPAVAATASPQISPTAEPTPCATPAASAPQSFSTFIESINSGDFRAAWSHLDPTVQQTLYSGDQEMFAREWGRHGTVALDQITYAQPDPGEAVLVVGLTFEEPQRAHFQYHLDLSYDPSACAWLIRSISLAEQNGLDGSPQSAPE